MSDWFEGEGRTDVEQRFLAVLRDRACSWHQLAITPDHTQAWTELRRGLAAAAVA